MKEIKTIIMTASNPEAFDKTVNDMIADGWELKYREVIPAGQPSAEHGPALYAEMERERPRKSCQTCKHNDSEGMTSLCNDCDSSYDKWEAAT